MAAPLIPAPLSPTTSGKSTVRMSQSTAPAAVPHLPREGGHVGCRRRCWERGAAGLCAPPGKGSTTPQGPGGDTRYLRKAPPRGWDTPLAACPGRDTSRELRHLASAHAPCTTGVEVGWGGAVEPGSPGRTLPQGWLGTTAGCCACARRGSGRRVTLWCLGHLGAGRAELGDTPLPMRLRDGERLRRSGSWCQS